MKAECRKGEQSDRCDSAGVHQVAEENDGVELRERERHGQNGRLSGLQVGPQRRVLDEVLRQKLRGRPERRGGARGRGGGGGGESGGHGADEVDTAPEDARAAEPRDTSGQRAVLGIEELQRAARRRAAAAAGRRRVSRRRTERRHRDERVGLRRRALEHVLEERALRRNAGDVREHLIEPAAGGGRGKNAEHSDRKTIQNTKLKRGKSSVCVSGLYSSVQQKRCGEAYVGVVKSTT